MAPADSPAVAADGGTRFHGTVSVLVADAQRLFAESLGLALSGKPGIRVVDDFPTTAAAALEVVASTGPDVVLVDYWLPGDLDAAALCRALLASDPQPRVLVSSWIHGPDQVRRVLDAGAVGFVPKSLSVAELTEAVHRAGAGEYPVFGEQLRRLVADIERRLEAGERVSARLQQLSPREREVLALLRQGRSVGEVAATLFINVGTARNHVNAILSKTGARTHREAVLAQLARGGGRALLSPKAPSPSRARASTPTGRVSVVVVDEQRSFAEAVACALESEHDFAVSSVQFGAGHAGLQAALALRPDVLLYDYWLPGASGPAASRYLRVWSPATRVVLLSWLHGRREVREAHDGGALGLLGKGVSLAQLFETVRSAAAGQSLVHAEPLARHAAMPPDPDRYARWAALVALTPRELEVLHRLAQGLSPGEVASTLGICVGTVKSYTFSTLRKTGCASKQAAVALARREGLLG